MKVFIGVALLSSLSVMSCTSTETSKVEVSTLVAMFHASRYTCDVGGMSRAVQHLADGGAVREGMSLKDLEELLGPYDMATSLRIPGGQSFGYGCLQASDDVDLDTLYWMHFRSEDWKTDIENGPPLLVDWD